MAALNRDIVFNLFAKSQAFERAMDRAGGKLDGIRSKLDGVQKKLSRFGDQATRRVTLPLLAAGGAAFKFASDVNEATNQVGVVFGDEAGKIVAASENVTDAFSKADFLKFAGNIGDIAQGMGIARNESDDMALSIISLGQDMSSFKDVPVEQAVTAITKALTGEREMLKSLGIVILETDVKQKALEMGLWDGVGALDSAAKAQATYQLITEKSANAIGDWDRTSQDAANATKTMTANVEDLAAKFGEQLLPVGTRLIGIATKWIDKFSALSPETQDLILKVGVLAAGLGPLAKGLSGIIRLFGIITAHPIVAAVIAIGAAFIYAYQNSETFRNIVDGVVDWFTNTAFPVIQTVAGAIGDVFVAAKDVVAGAFNAMRTVAETVLDVIVTIVNGIIGTINAAIRGINLLKPGKDIGTIGYVGASSSRSADDIIGIGAGRHNATGRNGDTINITVEGSVHSTTSIQTAVAQAIRDGKRTGLNTAT